MLEGLFVTPAVTAVLEALGARTDGKLAVIGNAKLATALAGARKHVVPVGMSARAAKRHPGALPDLSSVGGRSLAGVIGTDIATDERWERTLAEWFRVVADGGTLVFVDRGHAAEISRRALCAGLAEIQQRHVGRTIVTSGVITHLS